MTSPLIVALDFDNQREALALIDTLDPASCALKVGNEMFTRFGVDWVRLLIAKEFRVFLDLKFHDIPNTVAQACKAAADLGVWMTNVHASGGEAMMNAAREAIEPFGAQRPVLIAVTVLTSFSQACLDVLGVNKSIEQQVVDLALLARRSGLDGVVCSPHEVSILKKQCGNSFLTVTPGIRLDGDDKGDQHRIATPNQAIALGADYLVIGRSITRAKDPTEVIRRVLLTITNLSR